MLSLALGVLVVHVEPSDGGWPHPRIRIVADPGVWKARFGAAAHLDEARRLARACESEDTFLDDPMIAQWMAPANALRAVRESLPGLSAFVEVPCPSEVVGTGATLNGPFEDEFFHFVRVCHELPVWGNLLKRATRHVELELKAMPRGFLRWSEPASMGEGHLEEFRHFPDWLDGKLIRTHYCLANNGTEFADEITLVSAPALAGGFRGDYTAEGTSGSITGISVGRTPAKASSSHSAGARTDGAGRRRCTFGWRTA